ncbi:esterase-like activity of phytase family protein [Sphingomonas glaciei]|uniref:Esterase-like activity of phytase family protein n=1 Tax=Sphingomonas glaciei TaxID=2938948 RepID=A0ABY5MWC2_9SPHN|nr:esterase-like activity of phytase family protein [Sphingomonas glaciei]UUR07428.1 esterase-like activity of phytase family protein [Sphingomonas glaciei]
MSLILGAFLLFASDTPSSLPNRTPRPARIATLHLEPVSFEPTAGARITDAWTLTSDDNRMAGLSALAVLPDGRLQALSDSGALVTFARPSRSADATALVEELPGGPGYPTFKKYRDSEAMIVDRDGRGQFVAFENQHSLWRYESDGRATRLPLRLPAKRWKRNTGIEAMVVDPADGNLLLLHEGGRELFRVGRSATPSALPLAGATGGIADAVRLPDGRIVVAVREIGLLGLSNRLAWLEPTAGGYRLRNFATLPLGPLDNIEGLAAEPVAGGGTLLWAVTDNDAWRRTLLLRIELDTTKAPAEAGA